MLTAYAVLPPRPPRAPAGRARHRWAAWLLLAAASAYVIGGIGATGVAVSSPRLESRTAHRVSQADGQRSRARAAGVDADGVAQTARHQVTPSSGHPGELVATDRDYRVTFDAGGFSFTPTGSPQPVQLSLQQAARGGRDLGMASSAWRASPGGAQRQQTPGVREVVHVRSGEVEWDVVLASAPLGRGDLMLTSAVTGAARIDRTRHGVRLSLAHGGRVDIGSLVVKDASGRVLERAVPSIEGRSLRLVIPDHVLSEARYPLVLDPTVGPEVAVSAGPGAHDESAIASDGINYLVVWADTRNGTFDIYGARVRTDGTVLDPNGFVISGAVDSQFAPVVAYDGLNYLVVWQDARNFSDSDIYASRVTTSGTVLDTAGVPFSTAGEDQTDPDLVFNGSTGLVVWDDFRSTSSYDIYGARWTEASGLIGSGFLISDAPADQNDPAATAYGSNFLVVWRDSRSGTSFDIYATRVTTSGTVLDTAGVPFAAGPANESDPDVAFDGTDALIVWTDKRSGANDIYGARWSPTTGLLDEGGFPITTAAGNQDGAAVTANGSFLVTWTSVPLASSVVYGARVSHSHGVLDPGGFFIEFGISRAVTKGDAGNWVTTYDRNFATYLRTIAPK